MFLFSFNIILKFYQIFLKDSFPTSESPERADNTETDKADIGQAAESVEADSGQAGGGGLERMSSQTVDALPTPREHRWKIILLI